MLAPASPAPAVPASAAAFVAAAAATDWCAAYCVPQVQNVAVLNFTTELSDLKFKTYI